MTPRVRKSDIGAAIRLARKLNSARNGVRMTHPVSRLGTECATWEEYELLLHHERAGSAEQVATLRRLLSDARRDGVDVDSLLASDVYRRLDAARTAALAMARQSATESHKRLLTPIGPYREFGCRMHADPVVDGVCEAVGGVHRASVAKPHTPLSRDVEIGKRLDSARNAGLIDSKPVRKRTRRGGRKRKLLKQLTAATQHTQATIDEVKQLHNT